MEVEFAFLADGAQAAPDGKMYVLGGGIDRIFAQSFPARHPFLALVVKLKLHPSECERPHKLEIELWDRDGRRMGPHVEGGFTATRQPKMRPGSVQLVLNFMNAEFPKPDDYEFHILVDGQHRKTLPLYVEPLEGPADAARADDAGAPDASES